MQTSTLRIASLVPSITELLVELGLREHLVARTGFCVHPAEGLRDVPKVGGTKDVNLAKLRRLQPTHVIVNVDENTLAVAEALREFVPEVIVTHPCAPRDNLVLIDQVVAAFGHVGTVSQRACVLREQMLAELALTRPEGRPLVRVLYPIWRDPWMTVARDTYLSRMLVQVNWQSWPDVRGGPQGAARYPVLAGTEPWLASIQKVLLSSEPYAFSEAHRVQAQRLCPGAEVCLVDGELLSWYGPRALQGLRYLRELAGPV